MGELNRDRVDAPATTATSKRCRCCRSRVRDAIDRALRSGRSVREIARQFGFSTSAVHRHHVHVEESPIDPKGELDAAAGQLDEFLAAGAFRNGADVLRGGKQLVDALVRIARSLMRDNPKMAAGVTARALSAVTELFARAHGLIGPDAQAPTSIDNSVRIIAVLDKLDPDVLRILAGGEPLALTGDRAAP